METVGLSSIETRGVEGADGLGFFGEEETLVVMRDVGDERMALVLVGTFFFLGGITP